MTIQETMAKMIAGAIRDFVSNHGDDEDETEASVWESVKAEVANELNLRDSVSKGYVLSRDDTNASGRLVKTYLHACSDPDSWESKTFKPISDYVVGEQVMLFSELSQARKEVEVWRGRRLVCIEDVSVVLPGHKEFFVVPTCGLKEIAK